MNNQTKDLNIAWQACLMVMLTEVVVLIPEISFAASVPPVIPNKLPMGDVLCTVVEWFTGNTGKGLATVAVTVIGIGALLGKVSWGMAIMVGIGIAVLFAAAGIVEVMGAGFGSTFTCHNF